MYRFVTQAAVVFAATVSFGCVSVVDYQNAASGQIGCRPDEIEVSEKSSAWASMSWLAECRGQVFQCSAVDTGDSAQVDCTAMRAEGLAPVGGEEHSGLIEARLPSSGPAVWLRADPAASGGNVTLSVELEREVHIEEKVTSERDNHGRTRRSTERIEHISEPRMGGCTDFRLAIDGEVALATAPEHQVQPKSERLQVSLAENLLDRMRGAQRIAGASCGERWVAEPAAGETIDDFILRVKEERALSGTLASARPAETRPETPTASEDTTASPATDTGD